MSNKKSGCTHENLRSFTFSDGQTIQKCDGCTQFDTARRAILGFDTVLHPWWHKPQAETGYLLIEPAKRCEVKTLVADVPGYLESLSQVEIAEVEIDETETDEQDIEVEDHDTDEQDEVVTLEEEIYE